MKQYLLSAALFLMACGSSTPGPESAQTPEVSAQVETMRNQTAILVKKSENDIYQMYCSAVWISPTKLLTAEHCVRHGVLSKLSQAELEELAEGVENGTAEEPEYENHTLYYRTYADYQRDHQSPTSQRARTLRVLATEKATDLALLEVAGTAPAHGTSELHESTVGDGSFVWAMGHSSGLHFTVSHGVISASRREADLTLLQVSIAASGGNSGGPVFDTNGKLLGIVSGGLLHAQLVTFATHRDSIKDFVDANGGWK